MKEFSIVFLLVALAGFALVGEILKERLMLENEVCRMKIEQMRNQSSAFRAKITKEAIESYVAEQRKKEGAGKGFYRLDGSHSQEGCCAGE